MRTLIGHTAGNVLANFAGRFWTAFVSIALVPIYIHFLGIENYGLLGFYSSVQVLLSLCDFGLSGTLSRELARATGNPELRRTSANLLRTLELVYWSLGTLCFLILVFLAAPLVDSWVNTDTISRETLYRSAILMAASFFFQWPTSLYSGGLLGCQKQVALNLINIAAATVRGGGSVAVLWLVSPTIEAFLSWQIVAFILQTSVLAYALRYALPVSQERKRFDFKLMAGVSRFAGSLGLSGLATLLLTQLDKVVLSKVLPLTEFGLYILACAMGSVLRVASAPISDAMFPRYVNSIEQSDGQLHRLFHRSCQFVAGLVFPFGAVVALFAEPVLNVWIGDPDTALAACNVAALIVIGQMLLVAMEMLDLLQVARGWLTPTLVARFLAVVVLGPVMWYSAIHHGTIGAAVAWILIYSCFVALTPHFVFLRLLPGEKLRWYLQDSLGPLALSLIFAGLWRSVVPDPASRWMAFFQLTAVWVATFGLVATTLPAYRDLMRAFAARVRGSTTRP